MNQLHTKIRLLDHVTNKQLHTRIRIAEKMSKSSETNLGKLRAEIRKFNVNDEFTVDNFRHLSSVSQNLNKLASYYEEICFVGKRAGKRVYRIKTEDPRIARWKEVWPEMFAMPAIVGTARIVRLEDRRL